MATKEQAARKYLRRAHHAAQRTGAAKKAKPPEDRDVALRAASAEKHKRLLELSGEYEPRVAALLAEYAEKRRGVEADYEERKRLIRQATILGA